MPDNSLFPPALMNVGGVPCKFCDKVAFQDPTQLAAHELICRIARNLDHKGRPIRELRKKEPKAAGELLFTGGSKNDDYDISAALASVEGGGSAKNKKKNKKAANRGVGSEEKKESVNESEDEEKKESVNESEDEEKKESVAVADESVNDLDEGGSEEVDLRERAELIKKFSDITQLSNQTSYKILASYNFNFDDAISAFYDDNTTTKSPEIIRSSQNPMLIINFADVTSLSLVEAYNHLSSHNFSFKKALTFFCSTVSHDVAEAVLQKVSEARQRPAREREREDKLASMHYDLVARRKKLEAREMALDLKARELEAREMALNLMNVDVAPAPSSPSRRQELEARQQQLAAREKDLAARENEVEDREWKTARLEVELKERVDAVIKRERTAVDIERSLVEGQKKLNKFEKDLHSRNQNALAYDQKLIEKANAALVKEHTLMSKEIALHHDWKEMEETMVERFQAVVSAEGRVLEMEAKVLDREAKVSEREEKVSELEHSFKFHKE